MPFARGTVAAVSKLGERHLVTVHKDKPPPLVREPEWIECFYCGAKEHVSKLAVTLVLKSGWVTRVCRECLTGRLHMQ